jgi:hypothetical protein
MHLLFGLTSIPRGAPLYQVKIEHADEAGKIFETLMAMLSSPGASSSSRTP